MNTGTEPGDDDRINAIKEAIDILQQELADLEAIEQEARMERLVARLDDPLSRQSSGSGESTRRPAAT